MSYMTKEKREKTWQEILKEAEDSKELSELEDALNIAFYKSQHPDALVDSHGRPVWVEDGVVKTGYELDRRGRPIVKGQANENYPHDDIHEGVPAQMRNGRLYLQGPTDEESRKRFRDLYREGQKNNTTQKKNSKEYRTNNGSSARWELEDRLTYDQGNIKMDEKTGVPWNKKLTEEYLEEVRRRKNGK